MLIIHFSDAIFEWHVGEQLIITNGDVDDVRYVLADGHELEFIKKEFVNITYSDSMRIVKFYGDQAKSIVGNLNSFRW